MLEKWKNKLIRACSKQEQSSHSSLHMHKKFGRDICFEVRAHHLLACDTALLRELYRLFGGEYSLHLQCRRVSRASKRTTPSIHIAEKSPNNVRNNLTVAHLRKTFPAFHRTRRLITVFTRARHWSLSSATRIQFIHTLHALDFYSGGTRFECRLGYWLWWWSRWLYLVHPITCSDGASN
jgi:hypothetical protein